MPIVRRFEAVFTALAEWPCFVSWFGVTSVEVVCPEVGATEGSARRRDWALSLKDGAQEMAIGSYR